MLERIADYFEDLALHPEDHSEAEHFCVGVLLLGPWLFGILTIVITAIQATAKVLH